MTFQRFSSPAILATVLVLAIFVVACGGEPAVPTAAPALTTEPTPTTAPAPTAEPVAATTAPAIATPTAATTSEPTGVVGPASSGGPAEQPTATSGATAFTLGEGTIARYKVEEVLANTGFKIATGETEDVAGGISFDAVGAVVAEDSRITVQAATLRTDSNRRDGYVRNRTLETDTYPEVVFQATSVAGLPESLADASGPVAFTITGDLTVKDQTREVTWDAMAEFAGDGTVSGFASVDFTFDDFGMDKPSVAVVLSVEDTILLELAFVGTVTAQ